MAQSDMLKRYLDAGIAFTQMTRERAEAIVQDLVENGEIRRKEAQKRIEELVERSQRNTEELVGMIRREVAEQLRNMGLEDLAKRAGMGDSDAEAPTANPTTVGSNPSETPNAADDAYPAPPIEPIKKAAKQAAKKASAGSSKAAGAKKAGAAKKTAKSAKATKKA